jgi:DNA-binding NtrC family response regulator
METRPIVLIYDRNPNIRQFLKRELEERGYKVRMAKSPPEVLKYSYWPVAADVVVVDPDGIHMPMSRFLDELDRRSPDIPVILHGFNLTELTHYISRKHLVFVEKRSNSIDSIVTHLCQIFGTEKR